ncbi:hypothetical protein EVJ58_g1080 [Rhodofomes roseus]|uniref:Uncharacterized protein n=1 Tax=Rhodofomes roseus TaxID=34475 RepID=A0A4Y9Z0Z4_9APHY|nr:hypothetical protein EVJ58_g1080 [Rhodofomes roseus]
MTGPSSSVTWPPPPLTGHTLAPLTTTRISAFDAHDPLTINALRVLSTMRTLEHISARLDLSSDSDPVAAPPGRPFRSLKSLRLFAHWINDLTLAVIKSISSTELQCLELTVKARAQSHLSEQFLLAHMTALSQAPFRNSLREFKLYLHHDEQVDLQWNIGSQILRPVLGRLDSLVSLQIFGDAIALDFEICRSIAEAFPHLEILTLMDEGDDPYAGSLSPTLDTAARSAPLEGLAFFAKHCRALTSLRMPVRIESSVLPAWPAAQDVSATIQDGLILLRLEGDEEAVVYDSVRAYVDVLLPAYEGLFMY